MARLKVTFTLVGDRSEMIRVRDLLRSAESGDPTSYMFYDSDRDSMELGEVEDATDEAA